MHHRCHRNIYTDTLQSTGSTTHFFIIYKNHNTLKARVAVTPSGAICFVSDLYGGNISDRELTKQSGLLDLLEPGDSVMADRGFTIAGLKTNEQFTQREITNTRRIANLRIHVKRAIGRIKYFKLLSDLPNSMARAANQIFFVCSGGSRGGSWRAMDPPFQASYTTVVSRASAHGRSYLSCDFRASGRLRGVLGAYRVYK